MYIVHVLCCPFSLILYKKEERALVINYMYFFLFFIFIFFVFCFGGFIECKFRVYVNNRDEFWFYHLRDA